MSKKTIAKKIATAAGALILGTASLEAVAQDNPKVNVGFNAIEAGITDQGNLRTRTYTNIGVSDSVLRVDYHGLNEITSGVKDGYFGRHTFMLGFAKNDLVKLANVVKTATLDGKVKILDYKAGVRLKLPMNAAMKVAMDYGFIDATADDKAFNVTLFVGKDLGKGWSAEVTGAAEVPYSKKTGKPGFYTEVELYKNITKDGHVAGFLRGETNYMGDNKVVAGIIGRL